MMANFPTFSAVPELLAGFVGGEWEESIRTRAVLAWLRLLCKADIFGMLLPSIPDSRGGGGRGAVPKHPNKSFLPAQCLANVPTYVVLACRCNSLSQGSRSARS